MYQKIIIIIGDLNARVGSKHDFIENELILPDLLPDEYSSDTNLPRKTQDLKINSYGNELLNYCKQTGFRIMNGRLGEDKHTGKYTCVTSNGSSIVDNV